MEDNICEEIAIKINWLTDVYENVEGIIKSKDTNLPLNGIYTVEDGTILYFKNGKYHNENGPAYIAKSGYKIYYINGKRHRIDGPAIIYSNQEVYYWFVNGYKINDETMENWLAENDIPLDYKIWTDSDKMMFALHWSDYSE